MPRSSRRSLVVLVSLVSLLTALLLGCGSGDPATPPAGPAATQQPTDPTPKAPIDPPRVASPDEALPPAVASVLPARGTVGSVGPTVVVTGTNFVPRSIVQLDGAPLATNFV